MVSFVNISACDSQEKEKGGPESHHYTLKSNTHLFNQIYNWYSSDRLLIFYVNVIFFCMVIIVIIFQNVSPWTVQVCRYCWVRPFQVHPDWVGGLYGGCIVSALRHPHSDFHSSYVHQQCVRWPPLSWHTSLAVISYCLLFYDSHLSFWWLAWGWISLGFWFASPW